MGTVIGLPVKRDPIPSEGRIGLGLLILVLGGCFFWYVLTQLRQRSYASGVVAAAIYLSALFIGKKRVPTLEDFEVWLPKYDNEKDSHCFPPCLLEAIRDVRGKDRHVRAVLESLAYAFLIISTIAALEERLQAAGRMVHELDLKTPGLKNLLKSRGIGDSAMVANMLIAHAQIYHARKG